MTTQQTDLTALAAKLAHYARERRKMLSLDHEHIHALHSPPDPRHAELLLSDIEAAILALAGAETPRGEWREFCPKCGANATLGGLMALRKDDGTRWCLKCDVRLDALPVAAALTAALADVTRERDALRVIASDECEWMTSPADRCPQAATPLANYCHTCRARHALKAQAHSA